MYGNLVPGLFDCQPPIAIQTSKPIIRAIYYIFGGKLGPGNCGMLTVNIHAPLGSYRHWQSLLSKQDNKIFEHDLVGNRPLDRSSKRENNKIIKIIMIKEKYTSSLFSCGNITSLICSAPMSFRYYSRTQTAESLKTFKRTMRIRHADRLSRSSQLLWEIQRVNKYLRTV